jgi:hypothetical protein
LRTKPNPQLTARAYNGSPGRLRYVEHYNTRRLNSAIGYITPADMLAGRQQQIFDERIRKLAAARELRAQRRADAQAKLTSVPQSTPCRTVDLAAIRCHLQIKDVLKLLGFQPRTASGTQLRGACPLHGSTRGTARCFSVNTDKRTFHCFKCGCHGNALDLWAKAQRLTPYDAALDLCQRLELPGTISAPTPETEKRDP